MCSLQGQAKPVEIFDTKNLYSPVASHEIIRLFTALCAAFYVHIKSANVNNAYLYEKLYTPIIMVQSTNLSGNFKTPYYV